MRLKSILGLLALASTSAAPAAYDPAPWLADLAQVHAALNSDYANRDWIDASGNTIDARIARSETRIKAADSDATARRIIERMLERFHDGHIEISWPAPKVAASSTTPVAAAPATAKSLCGSLGYGGIQPSVGSIAKLPGYAARPASPIPAGVLKSRDATIGAIVLGVFEPQGYPAVCEAAVAALKIPLDKPCDDTCSNALVTRVYADLTAAIAARIAELRAAGADVLLVDVSGNPGGSEWVEAVARMLTPKTLTPAPWKIVRTPAWAKQWTETATSLTSAAGKTRGAQEQFLLEHAAQARSRAAESGRDCGIAETCSHLTDGGYATGMLAAPPALPIADESALAALWSPAQFKAPAGAWRGPLIVLADGESWSAAEELTATLQDNKAAAILGGRTGGAGCGHASGADPIVLKNSGGKLGLPDCARFRMDGSNEVAGIIPDVLTGHRPDDSDALKAKLIAAKLDDAVALARTLQP